MERNESSEFDHWVLNFRFLTVSRQPQGYLGEFFCFFFCVILLKFSEWVLVSGDACSSFFALNSKTEEIGDVCILYILLFSGFIWLIVYCLLGFDFDEEIKAVKMR